MHPPTGPALLHQDPKHSEVTLQIENVTGDKAAPVFYIYLNVPAGDAPERYPELYAGSLAPFGLVGASRPDSEHGGNGLTFKLDVTALFARLTALKGWDPKNLKVSFVPSDWDAPVPQVRVGRVSLYFS
jgi:hypothetical protein